MNCPLCTEEVSPEDYLAICCWQPDALKLAHKMNPEWEEEQGACRRCFDALIDAVYESRKPRRLASVQSLTSGFRFVLTEKETALWQHQNPKLQRSWQNSRIEELSNEAISKGYKEWFIFDADEQLVAQGRVTSE